MNKGEDLTKRVLILNDDHIIIQEILSVIEDKEKLDIRVCTSNHSVLNLVPKFFLPQYAVIDFKLNGETSLHTINYLHKTCKSTLIIVISSTLDKLDSHIINESKPSLYFNLSENDTLKIFQCIQTIISCDQMKRTC